MLVIFEGVDGSGKTTLIKKLKEIYHWKEIEWPGKQKDAKTFLEMVKQFRNEHEGEISDNKVYLMDRGGLGELIYGTLENRLDTDPDDYVDLVRLWEESVLVFCNNNQAYENAITRGEDGIAKDALMHKTITDAYLDVVNDCRGRYTDFCDHGFEQIITYDYSDKDHYPHCAQEVASAIICANFHRIQKGGRDGH